MFDNSALSRALVYLPISAIGIWRWTYWLARKVAAATYRPITAAWPMDKPKPTISVVTPVYNEDPELFEAAMQSWIRNGVNEIIAVIDKSNHKHIVDYERRYRSNKSLTTKCRLIVTPKPGKRAALCDGIEAATGDLIALVDSDTYWSDNVVDKALPCFLTPTIGGVTVAQRISNPTSVSNVLFDMLLWNRYREEIPFLLAVGNAFTCLSGRTAIYRREALLPEGHDNIHMLRHEFFLGTRGVSGDDKRLTHLILEQGWHLGYAYGATVYTSGLGDLRSFMKQRLRWTRNSWRADLRAVAKGWVWKHPGMALYMSDRFVQPLIMLIGPVVFVVSLADRQWLIAAVFIAWWTVSRFIRLYSYFRTYPKRLVYLPAWIVYTYANAVIRIYALATIIEHSWATRWHATRTRRGKSRARRMATVALGLVGVALLVGAVWNFVSYTRAEAAAGVELPKPVDLAAFKQQIQFTSAAPVSPPVPNGAVLPSDMSAYVAKAGDTPISIAAQFGMSLQELKNMNHLASTHHLAVGTVIYVPKTKGNG